LAYRMCQNSGPMLWLRARMKAFVFISTEQQHRIILLHEEGYSCTEIAKRMKCHRTTVSRVVEKYQITGSVDDGLCSGRPRKLRKCVHKHSHCRLLARGLKGCRARSKPLLTDTHHSHRHAWTKKYVKWTNEQWSKVIFSDESNFYLTGDQCNKYVRRFPVEEFRPYCLNLSVKHPLHMMIWGCIAASGIGWIKIVQGIMNSKQYVEVLEKTMLPSAQQLVGKDFYFQDDNAPCHRAKSVQQWMKRHGVRLLDWLAQSPDLNPIENLWAKIGYEISKKHPKTKQELTESIIAAWHHIVTKLGNCLSAIQRHKEFVLERKWYTS
uniref:Tc1-like transposase DDE domain-containing protein n=1 Tax=Naja naja TaxID=35670 RepID=A0A8C6XLX5_NAJNA